MLHVGLDLSILELAADEALGVEDGVVRVHGDLVLGGVTDEALGVGEGNERGGGAVTLVVGDNLNAVIAVDTHARVGSTKIDTDSGSHDCDVCVRLWKICREAVRNKDSIKSSERNGVSQRGGVVVCVEK